ncbi:MAG: DUF1552 domain-containing protein [Planctomycetes bacterium]|nr:DUF1552 domain-containing protein [Planctomycetota bacterium]MCH9726623.1 DUF1552 domain-containing protein [Planctomycetota bacterium]MCH9779292.1 DUF1552 domain-containing protein [Planctomycetota bacterium]
MARPISRRTVLQGMGAALALPWLDAMRSTSAAAESLSKPPVRTAFLFMPNGVVPKHWDPAQKENDQFDLTPMLKPLAGVKEEFLLLENLWNKQTVGRNGHWPKVPAFLSGGFVVRTSGRDMDTGGTSLDQVMARKIGNRTPLPTFELGVDPARNGIDNIGGGFTRIYGSHIAWRDPHSPVPKEIIPQLAFDRLFRTSSAGPVVSGFNPNQPQVVKSLQRDDTSVLDLVLEDAKSLQRKVGVNDRAKIDEYLDSVRSVERRIESAMKPQKRWINAGRFDVPRPGPGIPGNHEEHVRLMLDIMVLAFWTDSTRISTFMFGNAQTGRNFSFLDGVKGSFHQLSHHREQKKERDMYESIGTWHIKQLAYVIDKMRSLSEGESTLLDNSMLLFGSTIKDGNRHDEHNLPVILAGKGGGTIRPNRRLTAPKDTPLCNLYVSMLNRMGIKADQFGDSTGKLKGLI